MKSINNYLTAFLLGLLLMVSCTNLDEKIYSEVPDGDFYSTPVQVTAAIYRPWGHFCGVMAFSRATWLLQELSADGAAWPQKGRHGYDGGNWIRLHRHAWTPIDDQVNNAWQDLYQGVGYANKIIEDLEKVDFVALKVPMPKQQAIAELKIYRAFCYWNLMDLYGEIPIPTVIGVKDPSTVSRAEVFKFIEKEITDNVGKLSSDKKKTYGRASRYGAYALLARLYLNAEVYTGTPEFDKCIAACDSVVKSGQYSIDPIWNTPFKEANDQLSNENIWVVAFDKIQASGFEWYQRWFHYAHQKGWKLEAGTWNGMVIQPSYFDKFSATDKRRTEGMLIGPQYQRIVEKDGSYTFVVDSVLKGSEEYKDKPLVLVNTIISMEKGEENSGARSYKYEVPEGAQYNQSNDWVLFRYADILFMKAEALMRKNNNVSTAEAVTLINDVRNRSFAPADLVPYTTATLTMDELLDERGREFAFEGYRRTDLIRFNKFVTTDWWDKKASGNAKLQLFPIPSRQLSANPNLKPNVAN